MHSLHTHQIRFRHSQSAQSLQDIAAAFGVVEDITLVKASSKLSVTINAFIRYKYREDAVKAYLVCYLNICCLRPGGSNITSVFIGSV